MRHADRTLRDSCGTTTCGLRLVHATAVTNGIHIYTSNTQIIHIITVYTITLVSGGVLIHRSY